MKILPIILLIIVVILLILTYKENTEFHNLKIYDRALTEEEITEIYNDGPDLPFIIPNRDDIDTGTISYANGAGGIDSMAIIIGGEKAALIIEDTMYFDGESYYKEKIKE